MKLSKSEIEAVIAASTRTFVPFNKLFLSTSLQVRPEEEDGKQTLSELAASIHAAGLLHNLVVVAQTKGRHEVCACGRRWRAMAMLVADGRWPENQPVPVLIVPSEQGLLASLIENVQREAMHPADEFQAFARLIAAGHSVEDVAAVFGVEPVVVRRRLKLAAAAPALIAVYRAGNMDLECLMVLAGLDDQERQVALWTQAPGWMRTASELRKLVAQGEIESDVDPVARFVGLQAYEEAGGAVRRDLFCDGDKAYLLDPVLLQTLATTALQPVADALKAEGWRWVHVCGRYNHADYAQCRQLHPSRREPTDEEAAELAPIALALDDVQAKLEALSDGDDEPDEEAWAALDAEEAALQSRMQGIENRLASFSAEAVAWSGCVVHVGAHGTWEVKRGLLTPEDRKHYEAARAGVDASACATADTPESAGGDTGKTARRPVHSDRLMRNLTAHRVAAIQAELLERPNVALAVLASQLLLAVERGEYAGAEARAASTLAASDTHDVLRRVGEDVEGSAAWRAMEGMCVEWHVKLPRSASAVLPWMLAQDHETLVNLTAMLVARTVQGIEGHDGESHVTDELAGALGLDMRRWWAATGPSYLTHVSKARVLQVITEVAGATAAASCTKLDKAETVAAAERLLAGKQWLPACMRTPRASHVESVQEVGA